MTQGGVPTPLTPHFHAFFGRLPWFFHGSVCFPVPLPLVFLCSPSFASKDSGIVPIKPVQFVCCFVGDVALALTCMVACVCVESVSHIMLLCYHVIVLLCYCDCGRCCMGRTKMGCVNVAVGGCICSADFSVRSWVQALCFW